MGRKAGSKSVVYIPTQDPAMQGMSSAQLIEYAEQGEKQCAQAGVEMLRRKRNRMIAKAAEAKAA
jgi:hypothetical protein